MKQPYGNSLPGSPTTGDICFRDDGTLHFCYTDGVWTGIGGSGGSSISEQYYDQVPLALVGTPVLTSNFIGLAKRKSPFLTNNYGTYALARWRIWEFNYTGTVVNSWENLQFATAADLYSFLSTNAVTSGGMYSNSIVGLVYDIIDTESPAITKIYGMNTFYSLLRGTRAYKRGNLRSVEGDASGPYLRWGGFSSWFEDLCNQGLGLPAGYAWNPADQAFKSIWFPRGGGQKLYGLPPEGFSSFLITSGRREWAWGTMSWQDTPSGSPLMYENQGGLQAIWCLFRYRFVD